MASPAFTTSESHQYEHPDPKASRSPCPALNALANHGYIPRNGKEIPFLTLLSAVKNVYNLSYPLALILTFFGYLTCGRVGFNHSHTYPIRLQDTLPYLLSLVLPLWLLDLSALCSRGPTKIAHDGSLVHRNGACAPYPDSALLKELLKFAHAGAPKKKGLTLADLAYIHALRENSLEHPPNWLHEQVALGECGLAWCVMQDRTRAFGEDPQHAISASTLEQWFGQERLPDNWWGESGLRPSHSVGFRNARKSAFAVDQLGHHNDN